jgi:hypothetical protein
MFSFLEETISSDPRHKLQMSDYLPAAKRSEDGNIEAADWIRDGLNSRKEI